ncbi:MAG: hypothetical protein ACK46Q_14550 [Hyphomonas sp.]
MKTTREKFEALREQAIWLRHCFNVQERLFASAPETDRILVGVAPAFFVDLSNILNDYLVILITKITDRAESLGAQNLTTIQINQCLESESLMTAEIQAASNALSDYGNILRAARNKLIAHADLNSVMNDVRLGAHRPEEMYQFFEDLQLYFDLVGIAVGSGPSDFRTLAGEGDVLDLISALKKVSRR